MKLVAMTIVKDGMPTLPSIFFNLNALKIDWHWIVAHGASANVADTSWCAPQAPGLSTDGTSEFLDMIRGHPRVTILENPLWPGKTAQCNACLALIKEHCVLMQIDSDELWSPEQLTSVVELFKSNSQINRAYFYCRYYVGPNIIITSENGYGNRKGLEWLRAWRYIPGQRFSTHEPPVLDGNKGAFLTRETTKQMDLIFSHYAYAFPNQVEFKQSYYGYRNALQHWQRLQQNTIWPITDLKLWLPWVGNGVTADKI